ncbi:MAG TPA: DinB family protein [Gemmatimonadales bacterium]|nr:DinB family protein [Gemmatimonadales bacterium]
MATARQAAPLDLAAALLTALATSERITQYLLESLPAAAWRAEPPGGDGRTVAAIVAHVHNVRLMWLKAAAPGGKLPAQLDRLKVTSDQARKALATSHAAVAKLVASSLASGGKVKNFPPDVAAFVAYLIAHEAHHRGQVCMLTRQLGHRLPNQVTFGMWEWNARRKEAGVGD